MKPTSWIGLGILTSALLLAAGPGSAGGKGDKVQLTDAQFTKLVTAEAKYLQETLAKGKPDKMTVRKLQNAAMMIAGAADCSNHADRDKARNNAKALFQLVVDGDFAGAQKMASTLYPKILAVEIAVKQGPSKGIAPFMYLFASERVGGFGVEQELGDLEESKDKLKDAQFERLTDLSYKIAVIGKAADHFPPAKDEGDRTKAKWQAFTAELRQGALGLATAAADKNEAKTRKALEKLNKMCTQCHDVFRE
jgi:hypothetical protein